MNAANNPQASRHRLRKNHLAAMVTSVLALCGSAHANTIFLTSCTDTGMADTGNLRNSILGAGEGDTIDLGLLTCPNSRISLLLGQITIARNDLTIQRMGTPITIDGLSNGQAGMFRHTGTGTLNLIMMALSHGYVSNSNAQTAQGGCVYSAGNVYMNGTTLTHCFASTLSGKAYGGAAYTKGQFKAKYSTITQNNVNAFGAGTAAGGGVFSKGGFDINLTSISGNTATGGTDTVGICAGACITGATSIQNSTIAGNAAHARIGAISVVAKTGTVLIQNSTISGNTAGKGPVGGVLAYAAGMTINNSTIVLNTAATGNFGGGAAYAPGLAASYGMLSMTSSLIANNSYGVANTQNDLTLGHGATLATVSKNLVRTTQVALPGDTLRNVCPVLGPLRDNGGMTKTHALLSHSPAIDAGANPANVQEDQRGRPLDVVTPPLPFPRLSGTANDIGAFEVQQNDEIFSTEFEGCP